MFLSDEPGYYEDGEFGIRIENIILVKEVELKVNMCTFFILISQLKFQHFEFTVFKLCHMASQNFIC